MTDLHFQEQGSVWLVRPITPTGEAWMTDHTSAPCIEMVRRDRDRSLPRTEHV